MVFVKAEALRHVADVLFDLAGFLANVEAEATATAGVGRQQAAKHPQKGRLAAAVRAQKPVNLAAPYLHGDVVDDRAATKSLGDALHVNDEVARVHVRYLAARSGRTSTGWPTRSSFACAGGKIPSTIKTSFARFSWL